MRSEERGQRRITLIAYWLEGTAYKPVEPDEQGRVWLEPVGLWLGVKKDPATGGDRLVLIDPATIPYAARSETSSNVWNLSVISVSSCSAWIVGRSSRVCWMAA